MIAIVGDLGDERLKKAITGVIYEECAALPEPLTVSVSARQRQNVWDITLESGHRSGQRGLSRTESHNVESFRRALQQLILESQRVGDCN